MFLSKAYGDKSVKITAVRGYTEPFVFHSRTATVPRGHCVQITTNHLFLWIVPRLFYRFSRAIVILVNSSFRFHDSANRICTGRRVDSSTTPVFFNLFTPDVWHLSSCLLSCKSTLSEDIDIYEILLAIK